MNIPLNLIAYFNRYSFVLFCIWLLSSAYTKADLIPVSPEIGAWEYWKYDRICPRLMGEAGPFTTFDEARAAAIGGSDIIDSEGWSSGTYCASTYPVYGLGILTTQLYRINYHLASDPNETPFAYFIRRGRSVGCPTSTQFSDGQYCYLESSDPINNGNQCDTGGSNPIHIGSGNKFQIETDFQSLSSSLMKLQRTYNSNNRLRGVFGAKWTSLLDMKVIYASQINRYYVQLGDGKLLTFLNDGNGAWYSSPTLNYSFTQTASGYEVTDANKTYTFNSSGKIESITQPQNGTLIFNYDNNQLKRMQDDRGHYIDFSYNAEDFISSATTSTGLEITYLYNNVDGSPGYGNLQEVEYTQEETFSREYHYENSQYPNALTGITDENQYRYVSWEYDGSGRAISSAHKAEVDGVEIDNIDRVSFDFSYLDDVNDSRVTVTNPLGKNTTYHFQNLHGAMKIVKAKGHQSVTGNCAAASQYKIYYPDGSLQTQTDWEGNVTYYKRDQFGRITLKVEGYRWPAAQPESSKYGVQQNINPATTFNAPGQLRTTQTQWHTVHNKPERIIEADRKTTYCYFNNGQLKTTIVQPIAAADATCP